MFVNKITVRNFRNHTSKTIEFTPGVNADSCTDGLSGVTVQLTANITFNNTGNAEDWAAGSTPDYNLVNYMIAPGEIPFSGEFDGQRYKISNVYISSTTDQGTGIFSYFNGNVHDVVVDNSYIYTSKHTVGGLIGLLDGSAQVSNIYITKNVYVRANGATPNGNTGGVVGSIDSGAEGSGVNINNCLSAATVKAYGSGTAAYRQFVGGIIGNTNGFDVEIDACMNAGSVLGSYFVGGIVGCANTGLTLSNCLNIGTIYGDTRTADMDLYADIWVGNCNKGRTLSVTNSCGLGSKIVVNRSSTATDDSAGSVGTYENSGNRTVSLFSLYGSSASTAISGFTKRGNAIMIPSGLSSIVPSTDTFLKARNENGARIRINSPTGLRFEAMVNISEYGTISEYGFLYAPTEYVKGAGAFTESALSAYATKESLSKAYVKVRAIVNMAGNNPATDGYYRFALSVSVAEANYNRKFSAVVYVTDNTGTHYGEYFELYNSRSVADIARLACEDVASSSGDGYSTAVGTVYSCYSNDQRTELQKYFKNEIRVLQIEMGQNDETYDSGRTDVAVKEIYKYDPDVIILSGAGDLTFTGLTGYTTSGLSGNANGSRRVLFKTSRFTKGSEGDISTWGRYVYLTDTVTGKSSFFASVDKDLVSNKTYSDVIKNDGTIGNGVSKGLIIAGYFAGDGDNSNAKNGYLSSIHENATTQYYTNYYTRHNKAKTDSLAIMTGSLYKSGYADAVRYRISEEQFGMCSAYNPSVCDYILK